MTIYKLIANGSFGPDEIETMSTAYERARSVQLQGGRSMCLIDPRKILVQECLSRVLDCPVFDLPVGQVSDIGI